jgi:hypothetical protein
VSELIILTEDIDGIDLLAPRVEKVNGKLTLTSKAERVKIWNVKQGLVEDEDFKFVSADGWDMLTRS